MDEINNALKFFSSIFMFRNFSKTLISACTGNDVSTVKRLLGSNKNFSLNETDDGESLLSMACSAGYVELAQVNFKISKKKIKSNKFDIRYSFKHPPLKSKTRDKRIALP